jgi:hypothetical protein
MMGWRAVGGEGGTAGGGMMAGLEDSQLRKLDEPSFGQGWTLDVI